MDPSKGRERLVDDARGMTRTAFLPRLPPGVNSAMSSSASNPILFVALQGRRRMDQNRKNERMREMMGKRNDGKRTQRGPKGVSIKQQQQQESVIWKVWGRN